MEEELQHRELAMQAVLAEFQACTTEIQNRSDRQNVLISINLTAMGLIAATVLDKKADMSLLLVAAVLAPLLGLIWLDHASVISGLGRYIASEIEPFISMGLLREPNLLHRERGYTVRSSQADQDRASQNYGIPHKMIFAGPAILSISLYMGGRATEIFAELWSLVTNYGDYEGYGWKWFVLRGVGIGFCIYSAKLVIRFWHGYEASSAEYRHRKRDVDFTLARRFIAALYRAGIDTDDVPWYFKADKPKLTTQEYYVALRQAAQSNRRKLESGGHPISPIMEPTGNQEASTRPPYAADPRWLKNTDDWDGVEPRTVQFSLSFVDKNGAKLSDPQTTVISLKVQYGTIVQVDEQAVPLNGLELGEADSGFERLY